MNAAPITQPLNHASLSQRRRQMLTHRFLVARRTLPQDHEVDAQPMPVPPAVNAHKPWQDRAGAVIRLGKDEDRKIARKPHAPERGLPGKVVCNRGPGLAQIRGAGQKPAGQRLREDDVVVFKRKFTRQRGSRPPGFVQRPVERGVVTVAPGQIQRRLARSCRDGGEGDPAVRPRFEPDTPLQRHHGVKCVA